jgi:hypothetical protein
MFSLWSAPCSNRRAVFSVRGPCREDIREYGNGILCLELTSLEFRSSKGRAVSPEKELKDMCNVTCAVVHRYWECVI